MFSILLIFCYEFFGFVKVFQIFEFKHIAAINYMCDNQIFLRFIFVKSSSV